MRKLLLFVIIFWGITADGITAGAEIYDYPFVNPYEATVIGTPLLYSADLPKKVPVREMALTVFKDRQVPDAFWYAKKLKYTLACQKKKAPLIFSIAGTGSSYNSTKMRMLRNAFFQAGFHVISLTSPTHPDFMVSASASQIPGHLAEDARDLYRVMEMAWGQVRDKIDVSEFYLTGYSLGGAEAVFISRLDEKRRTFRFKKVLMINPPVNLFNSVRILDRMLTENTPDGPDRVARFLNNVLDALSEYYRQQGGIDFNDPDLLYDIYKKNPPAERGLAGLIGASFRLSSASMIFTTDVLNNLGYIVPKNRGLGAYESTTDYFKVTTRVGFTDYFHDIFYPHFKARYPDITPQDLIRSASLESIETYLKNAKKIGVMHNEDDLILAPGETEFFKRVFGDRAKFYPNGGHCGNMQHKSNVAYMINFFK
ncbi:alpha/beta hydrolase [Desulfonema ishimotonii]|uniref:Alpha/beta hydrolase n=1 Tax=Desulfonema ishimotonii TaxID=45657 RepID=A0A401G342_9BACT|nr:alpha/beta fold hydrolase [Desulfonema ishimotonii]GBC63650.1 alpha/beta hydrolase [Desulfonema ishimotonii]